VLQVLRHGTGSGKIRVLSFSFLTAMAAATATARQRIAAGAELFFDRVKRSAAGKRSRSTAVLLRAPP
jgi:hypothetical protein